MDRAAVIGPATDIFISVSGKPGSFGATVFNTLFKKYKINAVYLPRRALVAAPIIEALRCLDIRGCSVSSPLKSEMILLMDELDPPARKTNSVNTILNRSGKLLGHNTDLYGVIGALKNCRFKNVLIYGYGSVTNTIVAALTELGLPKIFITGRDFKKAEAFAQFVKAKALTLAQAAEGDYDLLINATPASQEVGSGLIPLVRQASHVFDLVVSAQDTFLIGAAKENGKVVIPGVEMAKLQLQKQFEIYTGGKVSLEEISLIVEGAYR